MCAHRGGYWCKRWCNRAKPGWTIGVRGVTPWDSSQLQGVVGRCVCSPPPHHISHSLPTIHWGVCSAWSLPTPSTCICCPVYLPLCFISSLLSLSFLISCFVIFSKMLEKCFLVFFLSSFFMSSCHLFFFFMIFAS